MAGVVTGMTIVAAMPSLFGGKRDALGVVAGRSADDTSGLGLGRQAGHAVIGAADLEREDGLKILALEHLRSQVLAPSLNIEFGFICRLRNNTLRSLGISSLPSRQ
jgi:hypothetical protein